MSFGFSIKYFYLTFLPRDGLQCKARSCYRMSSVRLSVCDAGGSGVLKLQVLENASMEKWSTKWQNVYGWKIQVRKIKVRVSRVGKCKYGKIEYGITVQLLEIRLK